MKKLSEIIDICKNGDKPTIDEARLAICVMYSLMILDGLFYSRRTSREMKGKNPDFFSAEHDYTQRFNRIKSAMNKSPLEYLGDNNNPDNNNPDSKIVQKRRKISNKIYSKIISK